MATYSNREFATTDELFKTACEVVDLKPTKRQASKWKRGTGKARNLGMQEAIRILNEKHDAAKKEDAA